MAGNPQETTFPRVMGIERSKSQIGGTRPDRCFQQIILTLGKRGPGKFCNLFWNLKWEKMALGSRVQTSAFHSEVHAFDTWLISANKDVGRPW